MFTIHLISQVFLHVQCTMKNYIYQIIGEGGRKGGEQECRTERLVAADELNSLYQPLVLITNVIVTNVDFIKCSLG